MDNLNLSEGTVALWAVESQIYPQLDAMGMRRETTWKSTFKLGDGHRVYVGISSKTGAPLSLQQPFRQSDVDITLCFISGNAPWFRVDNQGRYGLLHSHVASGCQPFGQHNPISGAHTLSTLVSMTFEEAKNILLWKFPETTIASGGSFCGFK